MSKVFQALSNNYKRLNKWALENNIQAYRLYDWDLEELPVFVDRYGNEFVIYDRSAGEKKVNDVTEELRKLILNQEGLDEIQIHLKSRRVTSPQSQYQRLQVSNQKSSVQEGPLKFLVNLTDFLDTGLFLDHRPLRSWLMNLKKGQKVLNLFAYTGSLSVAAAHSGAWVTSLDLSKNYLDWAQDNFRLNNLDPSRHRFFRQDAIAYLKGSVIDQYDLIILDPPTFSKSEKMQGDLDVQRDHVSLIQSCVNRLKPGGFLYFSTNYKGFELHSENLEALIIKDVTEASIPVDFSRKDIHRCYRIQPRIK